MDAALTTPIQRQINRWEERHSADFAPKRSFYARIAIGQKRFGSLKKGTESPTVEELRRLAAFFGCSIQDLIN